MSNDALVSIDLLFGSIELCNMPPRIEGNDLIPVSRLIERDRHGKVIRDETYETGVRLINGAPYLHFWNALGKDTSR